MYVVQKSVTIYLEQKTSQVKSLLPLRGVLRHSWLGFKWGEGIDLYIYIYIYMNMIKKIEYLRKF